MAGRIVVEKVERRRVNGRTVERDERGDGGRHPPLGTRETWSGPITWFRRRDSQGLRRGRAPKVLDPFAGGGAIPLEAMRLGCDVTAMDINPVAWFILKCTLEYPQKLVGQTRPLPGFALEDAEFMEAFLKAKGFKGASLRTFLERLGHGDGGRNPAQCPGSRRRYVRSGPRLARARLGPLGAGKGAQGTGFVLSDLC